jgi:hypothetical protein
MKTNGSIDNMTSGVKSDTRCVLRCSVNKVTSGNTDFRAGVGVSLNAAR